MMLNERQKLILDTVIDDYIDTGLPVSSLQLSEKHGLGVCSATIRNDMIFLTEEGFLRKSYSSSGRVPTSKGYRHFIQSLKEEKEKKNQNQYFKGIDFEGMGDLYLFSNELLNELSNLSSGLLFNYVLDKGILWESGWENVILQPEMEDRKTRDEFLKLVDSTKEKIKEFAKQRSENGIEVFVGKENPIIKSDEFSMITCKTNFPNTEKGCVFVLLGPKRMPYRENIDLFEDVLKFLQNI